LGHCTIVIPDSFDSQKLVTNRHSCIALGHSLNPDSDNFIL
jgi:hypothetical protein